MRRRPQVGVVHAPGIDQTLRAIPDAFDVLEFEPQTLSPGLAGHPDAPRPSARDVDPLAAFPHPRVVHSVGLPFGNEEHPDPRELEALRFAAEASDTPWVSDHLNFNRSRYGFTGFLLPLPQTADAVRHAAERIKWTAGQLGRPILFETGANYLRPTPRELPDGDFFAAVAEAADCGILLDLHNLWTNERNGRQPLREVVDQLPLERVREVHIAGGFERSGYWIDAHSGLTPTELLELAAPVIRSLPNLELITFEIAVDYLVHAGVSAASLAAHLRHLRELSGDAGRDASTSHHRSDDVPLARSSVELLAWQDDLAVRINGPPAAKSEAPSDPGVGLYRELVAAGRSSAVVSSAPLTTRCVLLTLGGSVLESIVGEFRSATWPSILPLDELIAFESWLRQHQTSAFELPLQVLAFERALLQTATDGRPRTVTFTTDPTVLLSGLGRGIPPARSDSGAALRFDVTIEPPASGSVPERPTPGGDLTR